MMISPMSYLEEHKDDSYPDLIRERDRLIDYIREYEKKVMDGDRSDPGWKYCPSPDVQYQMHLEYLSGLCGYMKEKYNEEYVWGGRTLKEDADSSLESVAGPVDAEKAERNFNATLELMKQIGKE